MQNLNLFQSERLTLAKAIDLTVASLNAYADKYKYWTIAFSGGKDSAATLTLICTLILQGRIKAPEKLIVLYADTRLELPPLHLSALKILERVRALGHETRIVTPKMDHRFFVYMLGRGVPPPSNTFRWCTPKLKVESMERELAEVAIDLGGVEVHESGVVYTDKFLMITGLRIGESAARDQRIAMSCTKDGGECGQGWFQQTSSQTVADTLAPILHWRVCHVWDYLEYEAPELGFETRPIAEAYGMSVRDGEEPPKSRSGCMGCPLVQEDTALEIVCELPEWAYLAPLKRLKPLYVEMKRPEYRLRKHGETTKAGKFAKKQNRLGPLFLEARQQFLRQILDIQAEVNLAALRLRRPKVSLINDEELTRIEELIALNTFPEKWDGTEHHGDEFLPTYLNDGSVQLLLFDSL